MCAAPSIVLAASSGIQKAGTLSIRSPLNPGGMTPTELLWACRSLASRLDLVGSDVVEVLPTMVGGADITALVADRVIRESLTGVALRRRAAREEGV